MTPTQDSSSDYSAFDRCRQGVIASFQLIVPWTIYIVAILVWAAIIAVLSGIANDPYGFNAAVAVLAVIVGLAGSIAFTVAGLGMVVASVVHIVRATR